MQRFRRRVNPMFLRDACCRGPQAIGNRLPPPTLLSPTFQSSIHLLHCDRNVRPTFARHPSSSSVRLEEKTYQLSGGPVTQACRKDTQNQEIRNSLLASGPPCGSFPRLPPRRVLPVPPEVAFLPPAEAIAAADASPPRSPYRRQTWHTRLLSPAEIE